MFIFIKKAQVMDNKRIQILLKILTGFNFANYIYTQ